MKIMERVAEKRGGSGSRSIDISGIPQSVLERSLPPSPISPTTGGHSHGRLNLYLSSPEKNKRVKSPAANSMTMTNGRSSHQQHSLPSPPSSSSASVAGLPLTKNVGVGVNLTQGSIGRSLNGGASSRHTPSSFATPQLPGVGQQLGGSGCGTGSRGGHLSHSPTPTSSPMTNPILPELLQGGRGSGKTTPGVPSTTSLMHLAKGVSSSLSPAQRDLFTNLNPNGNKIVSQNLNGTLAVTSVPTNDSELQLFRVLQRANLLNYFDVMIELGGDDVQQLCDAGEEEFLEIMALVGMASKPLHVRRLQKSLQDWMTQPSLFPGPVLGPPLSAFAGSLTSQLRDQEGSTTSSAPGLGNGNAQQQLPIRPIPFHSGNPVNSGPSASFLSPSELKTLHMKYLAMKGSEQTGNPSHTNNNNNNRSSPNPIPVTISGNSAQQPHHPSVISIPFHAHSPTTLSNGNHPPSVQGRSSPSPYQQQQLPYGFSNGVVGSGTQLRIPADQIIPSQFLETRIRTRSEPNSPAGSGSSSESPHMDSRTSISPIPFLQDHEVQKIADAAIKLIQSLPQYMNEPRVSAKRKTSADYETVLRIEDDDPRRMDKVRKYAAIYGRYDCKRKVQKPLTIHELSVNEAASHLCNHVPALLTRRDELFLLARQVVRDAGLPYSSIISSTSGNLLISQIKNAKQGNTRMDEGSNGSSTDSTNSIGAKRLRLSEPIEIEEFNGPRSAPEIDTVLDESLVPNKNVKSSSDGQPSPFERRTPETGRNMSIYTESAVFSPPYDYEVPDDLSMNKRQRDFKDKAFKSYQVKSEPSS